MAACALSSVSGVDREPTVVRLQPVRALTADESCSDGEPAVSPDRQGVDFTRIDTARRQRRRLRTVSIGGSDSRPLEAGTEIVALRSFVENGGARLNQLLSQLRAKGTKTFRLQKVHAAEISKELLKAPGSRSAGGHRLYAARAQSE